jgi:hypothetical protein
MEAKKLHNFKLLEELQYFTLNKVAWMLECIQLLGWPFTSCILFSTLHPSFSAMSPSSQVHTVHMQEPDIFHLRCMLAYVIFFLATPRCMARWMLQTCFSWLLRHAATWKISTSSTYDWQPSQSEHSKSCLLKHN